MWYLSGSSCHCSQFILINIERKYYLKTMNVIFFGGFSSWNFRWPKPTVKISVNQKAMNGISESLQWRFRGIQGVKHHIVIHSPSFCSSLFNILLWVRTEQCQSTVHSFCMHMQSMFYNCLSWKGKFPEWRFVFLMQINSWKDKRNQSTEFTQFALCLSSCK